MREGNRYMLPNPSDELMSKKQKSNLRAWSANLVASVACTLSSQPTGNSWSDAKSVLTVNIVIIVIWLSVRGMF
jgi:hypothetical protein